MGKLFKKLQSKHKKGFTLFEVLVVVVIMAVLASIALPTYRKVVRKSRVSDGLNVLNMLSGAQEKYFMEHGYYAQNIGELKAPFKDTRPGGPHEDIVTTNFTYKRDKNCITAVSNSGATYTLVKNFKTKDKVVCMGADCADISEFVDEIPAAQYLSVCPLEEECLKNQNVCGELHFWPEFCDCKCKQEDYINCVFAGHIFNYEDCSCDSNTGCKEEDKPECPLEGNQFEFCDPCPNSAGVEPLSQTDPLIKNTNIKKSDPKNGKGGKGSSSCYHCGYKKVDNVPVCDTATGEWHCQNIYDGCTSADESGIDNYKECDGSDLGLNGVIAGNTCGVKPLVSTDCQVPGNSPTAIILPSYGTCELKSTSDCFDGEVTSDGCPPGQTKTCDNCQWGTCQSGCPADQTVYTGSQFMVCHTLNGVTDPDLYCGTMTGTKKCDATTNYEWVWDFTNATCEDVSTVNRNGIQCGSGGCGLKPFVSAECSLYNGKYIWQNYQYGDCAPKPGANCLVPGQSYGNDYYCMHNCKIAKCTNGSVYNAAYCYTPERLSRNGYTNGNSSNPPSATVCMQNVEVQYGGSYNCPQNPTCAANNFETHEANITTKTDVGEYCSTTNSPGKLALKVYQIPLSTFTCYTYQPYSPCVQGCPRLDRSWSTVYKCTEHTNNYYYRP